MLVGVLARGGLDFLEMALLDARFRARGPRPRPAAVLLLALDDRTMNGARRLSPVPRELLAAIVGRLAADGAKTIVLDVSCLIACRGKKTPGCWRRWPAPAA